MAITNYSELKTAVAAFALRSGDSDHVAKVPDFITLAEARLNRLLGAIEADTTLTGTTDSRRITTNLTIEEPIALFLAESGYDEVEIQIQPDGSFPYRTTSGTPTIAALDEQGAYIDFDCPLLSAYPFRFRYRGRIALSDSTTTNWLLTRYPDVYLAAAMVWGAGYHEDWPGAAPWKGILEEGIPEIQHVLARQRQGVLRVDPALSRIGRRSPFDYTTGS